MTTTIDEKVIPLAEEIMRTMRKIDELEWSGDYKMADFAKYHLEHLKKMEAEGEIWYPLF
jgi:hypothetical protein